MAKRKRPVSIEDLFQLRAVGRVAISPDGERIVFEVKRADPHENKNFTQLQVVPTDGSAAPRPLTSEAKHSDTLPRWSPDGSRVAFISNRDKAACLYVMSMDGGEAQRVTSPDGNVHDFCWSPDGKRLAFAWQALNEREKLERDGKHDEVRRKPQYKHYTRLHHKLDGVGWWNGNYTHIWVVGAGGGRARQLSEGDFDDREPRWSPDGRWIAFISNRMADTDLNYDQGQIYLVAPAGGRIRAVKKTAGNTQAISWAPDSRSIAFIGDPGRTGHSWKYNRHVWLQRVSGGAPRNLTPDIDNSCVNETLGDVATAGFTALPPIWSPDGQSFLYSVSEQGATRLYRRALGTRRSELIVGGEINVMYADASADGGRLALTIGTNTNPGDIFSLDGVMSAPRQLSTVNRDALAPLYVGASEPLALRSGNVTVHGWVIKPPGFNPRRRYPTILQIHGGPHAQYGHCFFHEKQCMVGRGYVVVYVNPRGSTGYGLKHSNAIHADWGNRDYQDLMKVADWIFAQPFVDRRRVGVTGGSYGGYMTNWIVGHTNRFAAAVTQRSVVSFESMSGTSDYGHDFVEETGGTPWENVAALRRQSPLTYVKNIRTPLLIEHEEEDLRCPIEQAEQLFTALRALKRTVELVRFEGESHSLCRTGRPQNRGERLRRIIGWFDKYLKPEGARR